MSANTRLKVVVYWHMHQPEYRDLRSGVYQLPWTYLHAIKDYVDMAAHLEAVPEARAVVNFAPILLQQIDDYAQQTRGYLSSGMAIRDPLLAALVEPTLPSSKEQRLGLMKDCLRANEQRLIARFPAYKRLADIAAWIQQHPDTLIYVHDQYLVDLVVWHHLAWMGETVRRSDPRIQQLSDKASGYNLHDRRVLLEVINEILNKVIGRYRALAARGQIELSMTPYAHPIVPLLLDIQSAKEAMPDAPLPQLQQYPDGESRARWHLQKGLDTFEKYFGTTPTGCWPSEGSVSEATLQLLSEFGFRWAASGESVLKNSLNRSQQRQADGHPSAPAVDWATCTHIPYQLTGTQTACFFRDDGLSDLVGFTYSDWHADDAVANLVHHLENIASACADQPASVVSIILDGENAWEYYPENGYYFLHALYRQLSSHPKLEMTTFSSYLDGKTNIKTLPNLVAGSWVYGTFSTWIGEKDKNRGWDMLGDAKRQFDTMVAAGKLTGEQLTQVEHQLAICEGSDWFWWFGDYNAAESVSDFERLYRLHLSNLYQMLGMECPDYLTQVFTHGSGAPAMGGTMRPGQES